MELHTLWKSEAAQVLITRWDRAVHPADRDGRTERPVIEFMRSGSYARRTARNELLVDANHVAFFNPIESFHVSHPCGDRNSGLTLRVSSNLLSTVLTKVDAEAFHVDRPFRAPCAISSPRCHLLQEIVVGILRYRGSAEPGFVEQMLSCLVHEAVIGLYPQLGHHRREHDPRQIDRVESVRRYLMLHWAERLTLARLADMAQCSTWHLAAIFRERVGIPIHRYLKRLRLRHALERLDDGRMDLTRLALDCGFNSHSHFTAAFRQEFGTTPNAIRLQGRFPRKLSSFR
jgi:AraC-like DNA-binding protein